MFKIRTLHLNDFKKLEQVSAEKQWLEIFFRNKLVSLLQPFIPYSLRFIPSIHLAVEEENILGFTSLQCSSKTNNCWEIKNVYVQDDVRNEGVGEELVKYALSVYGSYGIEYFFAEVESVNSAALSLFHRCGFRRYAKVYLYEKEFETSNISSVLLDTDFNIKPQTNNLLTDLEKLEISCIPSDLRPALGRSKHYFKDKKDCYVLIDKSRNLIVGWFQLIRQSNEHYFIELLLSPGWDHLYEQLLNTIISDCINLEGHKIILTVKVTDYNTILTQTLSKLGFLSIDVKELLVRTVWQKVKEKRSKVAKVSFPSTAPIRP